MGDVVEYWRVERAGSGHGSCGAGKLLEKWALVLVWLGKVGVDVSRLGYEYCKGSVELVKSEREEWSGKCRRGCISIDWEGAWSWWKVVGCSCVGRRLVTSTCLDKSKVDGMTLDRRLVKSMQCGRVSCDLAKSR
jgi:hypothetical protein